MLQTHEVASLVYVKRGVGGTLHSDRAAFTNGANGGELVTCAILPPSD